MTIGGDSPLAPMYFVAWLHRTSKIKPALDNKVHLSLLNSLSLNIIGRKVGTRHQEMTGKNGTTD